jgi:hypothetical protein
MTRFVETKINYYIDHVRRHWSAASESFTGGDSLLTALERGWQMSGMVFCQEYWLSGARRVCVYHVQLHRGEETVRMGIVANPYVIRLIHQYHLRVIQINERKQPLRRTVEAQTVEAKAVETRTVEAKTLELAVDSPVEVPRVRLVERHR